MSGWASVAARATGTGHLRRGERCQDALMVRHFGDALLLVAADGAGTAARGGAGAALACRAATSTARAMLAGGAGVEESARVAVTEAAHRLAQVAAQHAVAPRNLATTLIVAIAQANNAAVAHVGDGAAVIRDDGGWRPLSWPATGEHAGTTFFLSDAEPAVRVTSAGGPVSGIAVLTDGLERLVLDHTARTAHAPFFDMIARPLNGLAPGRAHALSAALARYLDSEAVTARTDDDKTLALAVRTRAP